MMLFTIMYLTFIVSIIMSYLLSNWLIMWMFTELNLYLFILMMHKFKTINTMKNMMYYFIIQAFSSMLFFLSIMISTNNYNNQYIIYGSTMLMLISIMIKLGMVPFQMWFLLLMKNMNWFNCFNLSTLQKLTPLFIFMQLYPMLKKFSIIILIINMIMSTIYGMNQINFKVILTFSSLNQLSWMMILIMLFDLLFFYFSFIYYIIIATIMYMSYKNKFDTILNTFMMNNKHSKLMILMAMLTLGGLPPFIGFLMKWMVLYTLKMNIMFTFMIIIYVILSSATLYYYMYLIIPSMFIFNLKKKYFYMKNLFSYNKCVMMFYLYCMTMTLNNLINST